MSELPGDLEYTEDHEWLRREDDGSVTIGITDHAQTELGDITFVEIPQDDTDVNVDDETANIESVKAASPIYSPVSGTIVEVNADLEESPEAINEDPYGSGWIFKVEMSNASELDKLMDAEAYETFLQKETEEE